MREQRCPVCKGAGFIHKPLTVQEKRITIIELYEAKMSMREIMTFLEYKSPASVWKVIKEHKRKLDLTDTVRYGKKTKD